MNFIPTALPGVVVIEPRVFGDERGFFMETWTRAKFAAGGIDVDFVQDNHSASRQWTLRGLHYQMVKPQGKLVRVVQGEVFDVAVDMRRSSPTFGRWVGERLSAENKRMLWVPAGFAHGFLVLSERCEFVYKCTDYYDPSSERTLMWNDRELQIDWPIPPGIEPLVSGKDAVGSSLSRAERYE